MESENFGTEQHNNDRGMWSPANERNSMKHLINSMHFLLKRMTTFLDKLEEQDTQQMLYFEEERIEHPISEIMSGRQVIRDHLGEKILNIRVIMNEMFSCVMRTNKFLDKLLARYCSRPPSIKTFWTMDMEDLPPDNDMRSECRGWDLENVTQSKPECADIFADHFGSKEMLGTVDAGFQVHQRSRVKLEEPPEIVCLNLDSGINSTKLVNNVEHSSIYAGIKGIVEEQMNKALPRVKPCRSTMLQTVQECGEGAAEDCEDSAPREPICNLPKGKGSRCFLSVSSEYNICDLDDSCESIRGGMPEENTSAMDVIRSCIEETCKKAGAELEALEEASNYQEVRDAEVKHGRLRTKHFSTKNDHQKVDEVFASDTSLLRADGAEISPSFLSLFSESEASSDGGETSTESSVTSDDDYRSNVVIKPAITILKKRLMNHGLKASYKLAPVKPNVQSPQFTYHCTIDGHDISATGSGGSKKKARQDAAVRMLELLSKKDDDLTLPRGLTTFTPQELDELSALSTTDDVPQNWTGRLRHLCADLQHEPPKYSKLLQPEDAKSVTVHCQALGFNVIGSGNKKKKAKRSAAKKLIRQYNMSQEKIHSPTH